MSYTSQQRKAHVRAVQWALHLLGHAIYPDGLYGDETARAVRVYQGESGLPLTGVVDWNTWESLFAAAREADRRRMPPLAIRPYPWGPLALSPDARGPGVTMVQTMLNALADAGSGIPAVPASGVLDAPTLAALERVRRIGGLPNAAGLDTAAWDVLTVMFNALAASRL